MADDKNRTFTFTDFNNPLLRRLQIEAPGTYHHSVMVSYLAEAAAAAFMRLA